MLIINLPQHQVDMASYYYGSGLTWAGYLQADSFVRDITGQIKKSGEAARHGISAQTREVVASNERLTQEFGRRVERQTIEKEREQPAMELQRKQQRPQEERKHNRLCSACGAKLSFWDKLRGRTTCPDHS